MNEVPNTVQQFFVAFAAVWIIIAVYLFFVERRVARLEKEFGNER